MNETSSFPTFGGSPAEYAVHLLACAMAVFHIYILGFSLLDPWLMNLLHYQFVTALALLTTTWRGKTTPTFTLGNMLLLGMSLAYGVYIVSNYDDLSARMGAFCEDYDLLFSIMALIVTLELVRRTAGIMLTLLTLFFIVYCFIGPWLPGPFWHKGYSAERVFPYFFGTAGIFNVPMSVASRFVYLFVLFGAFLEMSGTSSWFMSMSRALAGRSRGGAAKVAILSSGLMGMLSGTAVGNVITTGSLTIPLMGKHGYSPTFAGALEACASTGGQFTPPIMGAAVFLMAQMVGQPYSEIMIAAIIPAMLFYAALFFMVDLEARRLNLREGVACKTGSMKLVRQAYLAVPIVSLAGLIAGGYSVVLAGLLSLAVLLATAVVYHWQNEGRLLPARAVLQAVQGGGINIVQITATCAAAGIIMGSFALTGLGLKAAGLIIDFAQGSLALTLLLTMVITIILGMGLPTIAAYAICAAVVAPALVKMGVPELPAHLFILYFASFSAITPPVALASYAAAAIAAVPPMRLSLEAVRLGLPGFIIPYMFVYGPPLLLTGDTGSVLIACTSALLGIFCLSAAIIGHLFSHIKFVGRLAMLTAALILIKPGLGSDIIGLSLALGVGLWQWRRAQA